MSTSKHFYKGSCLCGAVQFEARNINTQLGHCHCSDCRKFHGAAFSTFAEVAIKDFRWLTGEDLLSTFEATNASQRQFCRQCGSSMTFCSKKAKGKSIEFALALLDEEMEVNPDAHIFVGSKVNWLEVKDGLPQYRRNRDEDPI